MGLEVSFPGDFSVLESQFFLPTCLGSLGFVVFSSIRLVFTGAHQMEPPSPIQALGVNPFPSRFIIRTFPRGDFARRRWEEPITATK